MITFKFQKCGNGVFVSHIDILRMTNRTLRRMGIPVDYSKGYNPHMLVNLSQPLPLGIASNDEWATVQSDYKDKKEFIELYNQNCPQGFKAIKCYVTETKPNIAGKVVASDYLIKNSNAYNYKDRIDRLNLEPYTIEIKNKNGHTEKEISKLIYQIKADKEGIYILAAFGNLNLRIDKLCEKINKDFNLDIKYTDITRLNQYVSLDGQFVKAEDYVKGLEK